jgi:hypothetical protein
MPPWFKAVDQGSAIPDSAIHQWKLDEGSGSTGADSIGTADGTVNGPTWVSGTYKGGYALSGDGTDDIFDVGSLGTFGSSMGSDFSLILTVESSSFGNRIMELRYGGNNNARWDLHAESDGSLGFILTDDGDNMLDVETSNSFDDGSKHRVVYNKTANSASGLEIWVDGTNENVNVGSDQNYGSGALPDFDKAVQFFATHGWDDSTFNHFQGTLDNIILCDDSLTSTEIQNDYDRQPWSP